MSKQPKLMSDFHKLWLFFCDLKNVGFLNCKKTLKEAKFACHFLGKNVY
ncbi:hypothetical protein D354_02613 [Enterococcus faecalis]|nr:hypothetical protein D354_02613 [Enterococcus faecalis]EPI25882.1 hypothetical protein D351_02779 [Enterococcus faecalis WKS-26-18-2]